VLRLSQVRKDFSTTTAVAGVDLEVPDGQMVGIIGRSGAGKSTLLRLINRLIDPSAGRIFYDGPEGGTGDDGTVDVTGLKGRRLNDWRRRSAMIFQQFDLVDRLDVLTNVLIGRAGHAGTLACLFKHFTRAERAFAIKALDRLDMVEFALQRAGSLSGGQQQRVAIARALLQEPTLLLADEPIASLDPRSSGKVMDALRSVNREDGITVLCNLHSLDVARSYCDRIVGMARGRIVFDGPASALTAAAVQQIYGIDDTAEARDSDRGLSVTPVAEVPTEVGPGVMQIPRRAAGSAGSRAAADIIISNEL
jgi:phosphonate transport system ATP-binding protein